MIEKFKGWSVQFLPEGQLARDGTKSPVPWIRRTKSEAMQFARDLAAHGVEGGKAIRVEVMISSPG